MTDQVADALTKIEAELAAVPDRPWTIFGCNMDKHPLSEFGYPQRITNGGAVLIAECYEEPLTPDIARFISHAPTYLAALVEVAKAEVAAKHIRHATDCAQVSWAHLVLEGHRGDPEPACSCGLAAIRAALDALPKAVQP